MLNDSKDGVNGPLEATAVTVSGASNEIVSRIVWAAKPHKPAAGGEKKLKCLPCKQSTYSFAVSHYLQ